MAKLITISSPTKEGTVEIDGYMIRLYVGRYQQKFLLQQSRHCEVFLTHFDSGYLLGSLTPLKLSEGHAMRYPKDRELAKLFIENLVAKHGADRVNVKLNSAPVIN